MNYDKMYKGVLKTEDVVKEILEKYPKSRDNDFILYGYVAHYYGFDLGQSMRRFLSNAAKEKAPAFATVTKCRRTLQGTFKHLRGEMYDTRKNNQIIYKTYNMERN